jgi:hypothetical protein
MIQSLRLGLCLTAAASLAQVSSAAGQSTSVCSAYSGAAFGICNAYCEAQDCDVRPGASCEQLRIQFERLTGVPNLPCQGSAPVPTTGGPDGELTPTNGADGERTPTDGPGGATPSFTPTDLPSGTSTPTDGPATPTETPIGLPTGTATASVTPDPDACGNVQGAAFGLCTAFCFAQDCVQNPNRQSCVQLRQNFQRQTGSATFPCEIVGTHTPTPLGGDCLGDCKGDGRVTVDEITMMVAITLGQRPTTECASLGARAAIAISDLVSAVVDALNGC